FVTAMMAFFLLMWLINTTTEEQKQGIADYFAPASVSQTTSGSGALFAGRVMDDDGVQASGSADIIQRMSPDAEAESNDADTRRARQNQDVARTASEQAEAEREQANFR